ncbi:novel acetylcholine receptor chaperone [Coccinella septempunctata]|uniref:novel acetylcholine receptor chaperone n=1 Tax=Coccinella septempunctata TaxID=41139 RepID=UPI001D094893|nr:novel acetylcholine receptor chaperone [Coccinella septempunctata]
MAIVLKSLSVLLGLFFIFVGFIKLTSFISKDLHKDLRKEYVRYSKVFPFSEMFDFKVPSKWYRRIVGSIEIACGIALAFYPNHKVKNGANVCLLFLTLLAVYSHYMVADKMERTAPALVFLFMLCGRLVVYYQISKNENPEEPTANGIKQD